jgi:acyl carrier protein
LIPLQDETATLGRVNLSANERSLHAIIADVLLISPDEVWSEAAFVADLHVTSLDFMEIVVGVEEAFGVEIRDRVAAELLRVADLELLIRHHQAARAPSR